MHRGYQWFLGVPEAGQGVGAKDSPCLSGQLALLLLCSQHEKIVRKKPSQMPKVVEPSA